ncbi:MAG: class I SAM-dependent methyltransferase [Halioglobus sp.]
MLADGGIRTCPCGAPRSRLAQYYSAGETDFVLCGDCGCVFRSNFPTEVELVDIYKKAYSSTNINEIETEQESGDYSIQSYANYLLSSITRSGDRILDYGAGTGALVATLRSQGYDTQGVEFATNAREFCATERQISLQANLECTPDNHYQVITMIEVIEHLTDLTETLSELYRVLAPGGTLLVTTPSRTGIRARLEKGYWREAQKKFHLFLFDRRSIFFHMKKAGFTGIRRKLFGPLQKPGLQFALYARATQLVGLSGTLCVIAHKEPGPLQEPG